MYEPTWDRTPFTYTLTYDHTDVVVKASPESAKAICELLVDPPSNELYSAFEFVQRQYYLDSAFHPWKEYKEHLAGPTHADKRAELTCPRRTFAWSSSLVAYQRMLYFRYMGDAEAAGEVVTVIRKKTAANAQMEQSI